jgi:hypothetical protein
MELPRIRHTENKLDGPREPLYYQVTLYPRGSLGKLSRHFVSCDISLKYMARCELFFNVL